MQLVPNLNNKTVYLHLSPKIMQFSFEASLIKIVMHPKMYFKIIKTLNYLLSICFLVIYK